MARFRVVIAPGVTHVIDALNEEEARKKTQAEIAKGAVSPFYDDLYFDYETGVNIKEGIGSDLRQKLGRAEISKDPDDPYKEQNVILRKLMDDLENSKSPLHQEGILQNSVGDDGFIRNTKGQVALTPRGLQLLGLPVQQRKLQDGSVINLNTIVDENSFNLKTGDLADLSGIAGPVFATIAAFLPQLKLVKGITSLLGGRERLARTFIAGGASVAGKGAEEYLDAQEGFQLQDRDEIADLLKGEFVLGSVGQGVFGEIPGVVFKSILGKKAPLADQRAGFVSSRNLSYMDVKKLDRESVAAGGKFLTDNQILKAAKEGKIKTLDSDYSKGYLPSRGVYGQKLPAQYQAIFERVLGDNRVKYNIPYLRAATNDVLRNIKNERAALNQGISQASKKSLNDQVNSALQDLRVKEQNVTDSLRQLLDDVGADILNVGDYKQIPTVRVFGEELKNNLAKAQKAALDQSGELYHGVDRKLINFRYDYKKDAEGNFLRDADGNLIPDNTKLTINRLGQPEPELDVDGNVLLKSDLEMNKSKVINKAINNIILKHLERGKKIVELDEAKGTMQKMVDPRAEVKSNIRTQLGERLDEAIKLAKIGQYDLRMIRNDANYLKRFLSEIAKRSDERKLLNNISKIYDDFGVGLNGEKNANSILTEIAQEGDKAIDVALANTGLRLGTNEKLLIKRALQDLDEANLTHFERMSPFDNIKVERLVQQGGQGVIGADDVFNDALVNGKAVDLENVFKSLRDYDEYISLNPKLRKTDSAGNTINNYYEKKLKADLKNRLFADALYEATKDELTDVNFAQFARELLRFEKTHKGKFDLLFTDPVTQVNTGPTVRATINQLNDIGFNPKPQELRRIINDITNRNSTTGLNPSEQGKLFVKSLNDLADATEERMRFEKTKAIADLPNKTIEETVNTIFRPGSASVINTLRNTVDDKVFNDIQQASMQKLLSKSIDLNGEGKVTDLFKSTNLKTSLDSIGDETLDSMFGAETRRGLRDLQQQIEFLSGGEPGKGGAAGALIAAGLSAAIVFQPLTALPTVAGLAIARSLLTYPPFVRLMSRSDQGSIAQALQIFNTTLRQFGLRMVDGDIIPISAGGVSILDDAFEAGKTAIGITDEDVDTGVDEGFNMFQQLREQVTAPIKELPQLPNVAPIQTTQAPVDPLSPERLDFAERIAGRPVV